MDTKINLAVEQHLFEAAEIIAQAGNPDLARPSLIYAALEALGSDAHLPATVDLLLRAMRVANWVEACEAHGRYTPNPNGEKAAA